MNHMKLPITIALAAFTFSVATATIASAAQQDTTVKCGEDKDGKEDKS